jgi:predicted ATP-dependent endonuclease of OLD family
VCKLIKSIKFNNFKTHKNFSISLKDFNILVGPNNSGKSTILDALRILSGAYRYASRIKAKVITKSDGKFVSGFNIPENSIPITIKHIQTNYNENPTTVEYKFSGNKSLVIEFSNTNGPILYFHGESKPIKNTKSFQSEFPLKLAIVPTLGPLEEEEVIHDRDYVNRWANSHRAPRLFRNMWYYNDDDFDIFKGILEDTWEGISIEPPEKENMLSDTLNMFCTEDRITREVFWAGNGFQIWLQLLTHLIKLKEADLIIIDEPEIYLHPDLQRKLISILRDLDIKVILATHSIEIINEVEPDEVVIIEKNTRYGNRLNDLIGLQSAVEFLGSTQNIHLTRLARGKRILFVEGKDSKLLEKFAKKLGHTSLFSNGKLTIIPVGGASQWEKISHAQWAFSGVLGEDIKVSALFDRDYKSKEQVEKFQRNLKDKLSFIHVLEKKEIENYLLVPQAIEKAISTQLKLRVSNSKLESLPCFNVNDILFEITNEQRNYVLGQLIDQEYNDVKSRGNAIATIVSKKTTEFEKDWKNLTYRLSVVPGKNTISLINKYIQEKWKISISASQIIKFIKPSDLEEDEEIPGLLKKLNEFVLDIKQVINN